MPMPGITINGHLWECFLFFELNKDLVRPCIPKLHCVVTDVNPDHSVANTFQHHLDLERDIANPSRATYSDRVGSEGVPGMVQRARSRRTSARQSEAVCVGKKKKAYREKLRERKIKEVEDESV